MLKAKTEALNISLRLIVSSSSEVNHLQPLWYVRKGQTHTASVQTPTHTDFVLGIHAHTQIQCMQQKEIKKGQKSVNSMLVENISHSYTTWYFCPVVHGNAVVSSLAMSSNSLLTGLEDLANLRFPWKPGGLCRMEGLDMDVTMMDVEALHPDLGPDSLSTLSSCWSREEEELRPWDSFIWRWRWVDARVKGKWSMN